MSDYDTSVQLIFGRRNYAVPIRCVSELMVATPDLCATMSYTVHARVSPEVADAFVSWLLKGKSEPIPRDHAANFIPLTREFWRSRALAECQAILLAPEEGRGHTAATNWPEIVRGIQRTLDTVLIRLDALERARLESAVSPAPDTRKPPPLVSGA
jgi:hypothetical protein